MPQNFKENNYYVNIGMKHLNAETVAQYQQEERTLMAKRIKRARHRTNRLLDAMCADTLSTAEKIDTLKKDLAAHYSYPQFLKCKNMGEITRTSLDLLIEKN